MRVGTYKILLGISVIFNIAFVGNVIYQRYIHKSCYTNTNYQNSMHHNNFEKMRFNRARMAENRREYVEKRREFIEMLMAPNFDEKALEKKLDLTIDKEKEMERKMGEHFIELRRDMTPVQAKEFFRRILRNRRREFLQNKNRRRFRRWKR